MCGNGLIYFTRIIIYNTSHVLSLSAGSSFKSPKNNIRTYQKFLINKIIAYELIFPLTNTINSNCLWVFSNKLFNYFLNFLSTTSSPTYIKSVIEICIPTLLLYYTLSVLSLKDYQRHVTRSQPNCLILNSSQPLMYLKSNHLPISIPHINYNHQPISIPHII